jgi:hypothetical protein
MKQQSKKYIIVLLICHALVYFSSCVSNAKKDRMFPEEKEIVLNDMNVGENMGEVVSIKSMGTFLVVTGNNMEAQVLLIDKKNQLSYMFGKTGEGPGRFLRASNIMPVDNKHVGIYDLQKRLIYNFNIDSIFQRNDDYMPDILMKHISAFSPLQIDRLNENKFVALDVGATGLNRFVLLDSNGDIISKEGELPKKRNEQISDGVHGFAYWGRVTANPKENKVAICTNYAGIIQIYDCNTDEVKLLKEHNLFLAYYNENAGRFGVNSQTRWGYISIDSNSTHIFALYSGLNQVENPDGAFTKSNIIHVFDWNGNPVVRLIVDRQLNYICVDEDILYGYDGNIGDILEARVTDIL